MAMRHLYPSGRFTELMMSGYTTLFGSWIIVSINKGHPALDWSGLPISSQMTIGLWLTLAGIVHAIGVRVNGLWWGSPIIRSAGMLGAAVAAAHISSLPENPFSSATFTYGFIFFWYVIASMNAIRDTTTAIRLRRRKANAGLV